jgi:hypothetical protein
VSAHFSGDDFPDVPFDVRVVPGRQHGARRSGAECGTPNNRPEAPRPRIGSMPPSLFDTISTQQIASGP